MGYAVGDHTTSDGSRRHIGYGVPATCDHPGCGASIDRGMGYACHGPRLTDLDEIDAAEGDFLPGEGCGMYFCGQHGAEGTCERCQKHEHPFPPTLDTIEWATHVLTDDSWERWRREEPAWVERMRAIVAADTCSVCGHVGVGCNCADEAASTPQGDR